MKRVVGKIVDIDNREIFEGSIVVDDGVIVAINRHEVAGSEYIMPGFIDAHVHIESSMLTPANFGKIAVRQGTVAVVTDPHEIANVLGLEGIDFMLKSSESSPIKTFFTIPSCVPATPFDISGSKITSKDVEMLACSGRFVALSEMMNVPGVLDRDSEVYEKLDSAKRYNLPVDGHAPMLAGKGLVEYVKSGISTDHECITLSEALEKIKLGMKIIIREGSAACNYENLRELIALYPQEVMFCCDDAHPHEIIEGGHIRKHVSMAIADGYNLFDVLRVATVNAIEHYKLDVGRLKVGDKADFIVVDNLKTFNIKEVYINGEEKLGEGETGTGVGVGVGVGVGNPAINNADSSRGSSNEQPNNFNHTPIDVNALKNSVTKEIDVIQLIENELITKVYKYTPSQGYENSFCKTHENLESDIANDILKIVYINRYNNGTPQVAYCKGFNLKKGAFASSVAHDSHNILAVGCSDRDIAAAVNAVITAKGGLAVSISGEVELLPLPIAGIMSNEPGEKVAENFNKIEQRVKEMGCKLDSPFMTLSFLSLVVIPELKIGEKGLFRC